MLLVVMATGEAERAEGERHRLTDNDRRLDLLAMKSGGWGKVQTAIRRAFTAKPGRPADNRRACELGAPRGAKRWNWYQSEQ